MALKGDSTDKTYTYLHMNSRNVAVGDKLNSLGICVGQQGKKGHATGYHVHFEVHIASSNIKPRSLPRARFFFVQFTVSSGENRVKIKIFRISGRDKEAHGEFI